MHRFNQAQPTVRLPQPLSAWTQQTEHSMRLTSWGQAGGCPCTEFGCCPSLRLRTAELPSRCSCNHSVCLRGSVGRVASQDEAVGCTFCHDLLLACTSHSNKIFLQPPPPQSGSSCTDAYFVCIDPMSAPTNHIHQPHSPTTRTTHWAMV